MAYVLFRGQSEMDLREMQDSPVMRAAFMAAYETFAQRVTDQWQTDASLGPDVFREALERAWSVPDLPPGFLNERKPQYSMQLVAAACACRMSGDNPAEYHPFSVAGLAIAEAFLFGLWYCRNSSADEDFSGPL